MGKGIISASIDKRGYVLAMWKNNNEHIFNAGCHKNFTYDEAIVHWGSDEYPNGERGQRYVKAVQFLNEMGMD